MRNQLQPAVRLTVIILVMLVVASAAWACPNCKEALAANDPTHNGMVRGYFYSILFMMGMPFALFTGFSIYMYRQVLRARALRATAAENGTPMTAAEEVMQPEPVMR